MKGSILSRVLLCSLCLLAVNQVASAARLDTLFQADAPANGRDTAAREVALKKALATVLVRITGDAAVTDTAAAQQLLANPGRYVAEFHFSDSAPVTGVSTSKLRLWAKFDEVALTRALREQGLPYWGSERPEILVWLAVDDNGNRFLVSDNSSNQVARELRGAAQRFGLPASLPLLDLQDQRAVSFSDLWGGFLGMVETASERYHPQVVLVGRLERSRAGWSSQWSLLGASARQNWTSQGSSAQAVVYKGLGEAAGVLATQYAGVASDQTSRVISVQGIGKLDDYARVQNYLVSLSPVQQVQVALVSEDEVQFSLQLNTSAQSLMRLIRLGRMLEPVADDASWQFRLVR